MLDSAFEALKTYEDGTDPNVLQPIDEAIVASHGDAAARGTLEKRLAELLPADVPRSAKDYVCRQLMVIGTASSVPTLAALLADPQHSHMARYALERIPADEAAAALRSSLSKVDAPQKIGIISSLGVRQDEASIPTLAELLTDADSSVARAAAYALGAIRSAKAAATLAAAKTAHDVQGAVTDACLACAEGLLSDGKKIEALALYRKFAGGTQPKHVRLAAARGMLACTGR